MSSDKKWQEIAWGEHLHMGLYEGERDTRQQAMMRATARTAQDLPLGSVSRVLEVGCGTGQAARHLANQYGCRVHATNIDFNETLALYDLWVEHAMRGQIGWIYYRLEKP